MSFTSQRDDDRLFFTPTRPHFFKIILDDDTRTDKLAIPQKFVKLYGSGLPDSVCLRVPSGAEWQVGLSKRGEKFWFQNGWREFLEYYCLDYGHLLVFELDGCDQFSVLMFDKSATEMIYPYNSTVCSEEPKQNGELNEYNRREKVQDDDSIEMLGDFSINRKVRGRSPLPCPRSKKKMKNIDSTSQIEGTSNPYLHFGQMCNECHPQTSHWVAKESKARGGTSLTSTGLAKQKCPLTSQKDVEACKSASDFQSEYPYFKLVMGSAYVRGYGLPIPAAFVEKYLTKKQTDATLYVPDGRSWPAKCPHRENRLFIGPGWHKFVCDNGLKVDDVCFFELIKISEIKLRVTIFREHHGHESKPKRSSHNGKIFAQYSTRLKTDTSHCCMGESGGMSTEFRFPNSEVVEVTRSSNSKGISQAFERASAFQSENPFFKLKMRPSYVRGRAGFAGVNVPRDFAVKYLRKMQSDVTLCVPDRGVWHAEYHWKADKSYRRTILYYGWNEFVSDNSLKVGDVCVFELTEISEVKFKVVIFRVNEDLNNQLYLDHGSRPNRVEPKKSLEKNVVFDCACKHGEACVDCLTGRQAKKLKQQQKFDSVDETHH